MRIVVDIYCAIYSPVNIAGLCAIDELHICESAGGHSAIDLYHKYCISIAFCIKVYGAGKCCSGIHQVGMRC